MDFHAVTPPEYQAGVDSKPEHLCQQDSEKVNKTTPGASLSRQLKTPGASNSGRPVATEDMSSGKKVYLRPNTDGEKYIKKLDDPANNVKQQSEEEHKFYCHAAKVGKYRTRLQTFLLNGAIWSQFTSESVQRQVKISSDRKDVYNLQILQD